MVKELCEYIVASGNLDDLIIGTTLHARPFPQDAPDNGTAILEPVPSIVNDYFTDLRQKTFQVVTRGATYHAARTESFRINEFLITRRGISLTGYDVYHITGTESAYIGIDDNGLHLWIFNIVVNCRKET
jgi:hypothetical protein